MSETVLMATRVARLERAVAEAEPVIVEFAGDIARLHLDDGDTIEFDARELRASLQEAA